MKVYRTIMSGRLYDSSTAGNPPHNTHRHRCALDHWENSLDAHEMADHCSCNSVDYFVVAQFVKQGVLISGRLTCFLKFLQFKTVFLV